MASMYVTIPTSFLAEVNMKNPDKMSERELRSEVKQWRTHMKNEVSIETSRDIETDSFRVKIHGTDIDGTIPDSDVRKLDAILNGAYTSYEEKIKLIRELVHGSVPQAAG